MTRNRRGALLPLLAFALVATAGRASSAQSNAAPAPLQPRIGVTGGSERLDLQRAVEMALDASPEIRVARIGPTSATWLVTAVRGAFDIGLFAGGAVDHTVSPVASLIGGSANGSLTTDSLSASAGIAGLAPVGGGSYRLDLSTTRFKSDSQFSTLNPQFPTALRAAYTQPLWRGLRFDGPRRQIEIARRNESVSLATFREEALGLVLRVEQAYWGLVFAQRNLETQRQALAQTQAQVASYRRLSDAGALPPVAVIEAETQASTFEQAVFAAQELVTRAENGLKQLILPDRSSPLWNSALDLTTRPIAEPEEPSLEDARQRAFKSRPELERQDAAAALAEIDVRFFQDQLQPQIDLVGGVTLSGLAGTVLSRGPNPLTAGTVVLQERVNELSRQAGLPILPPASTGTIPGLLIGGLGQSFQTLADGSFPSARLDVVFRLPLRNRTARANATIATLRLDQVSAQRAQVEQAIEAEVRNALEAVQSARGRLGAARAASASAQALYDSEQRQFDAGASTVFLVFQRQTALVTALARLLQAETDVQNAVALLRKALGEGLEHWNIRPTQAGEPGPAVR
jgi:HAE1 family hydrophobic/amphiphilic exporter-1